jgi:hypothetical protein
MSDISIEIVLEEMKDYKLPTAVVDINYLDAVKFSGGSFGKRKKRKVAEVNQEHENTTPDGNKGNKTKVVQGKNRFFNGVVFFSVYNFSSLVEEI